ncbi:hypothetical protein AKO1_009310 [Acrasis kona]|uniref:Uncharacterized protein n=1 Tax=Acrasis kona TaxID=1008807 RepID=A0AAW2ZMM7_9EUKA
MQSRRSSRRFVRTSDVREHVSSICNTSASSNPCCAPHKINTFENLPPAQYEVTVSSDHHLFVEIHSPNNVQERVTGDVQGPGSPFKTTFSLFSLCGGSRSNLVLTADIYGVEGAKYDLEIFRVYKKVVGERMNLGVSSFQRHVRANIRPGVFFFRVVPSEPCIEYPSDLQVTAQIEKVFKQQKVQNVTQWESSIITIYTSDVKDKEESEMCLSATLSVNLSDCREQLPLMYEVYLLQIFDLPIVQKIENHLKATQMLELENMSKQACTVKELEQIIKSCNLLIETRFFDFECVFFNTTSFCKTKIQNIHKAKEVEGMIVTEMKHIQDNWKDLPKNQRFSVSGLQNVFDMINTNEPHVELIDKEIAAEGLKTLERTLDKFQKESMICQLLEQELDCYDPIKFLRKAKDILNSKKLMEKDSSEIYYLLKLIYKTVIKCNKRSSKNIQDYLHNVLRYRSIWKQLMTQSNHNDWSLDFAYESDEDEKVDDDESTEPTLSKDMHVSIKFTQEQIHESMLKRGNHDPDMIFEQMRNYIMNQLQSVQLMRKANIKLTGYIQKRNRNGLVKLTRQGTLNAHDQLRAKNIIHAIDSKNEDLFIKSLNQREKTSYVAPSERILTDLHFHKSDTQHRPCYQFPSHTTTLPVLYSDLIKENQISLLLKDIVAELLNHFHIKIHHLKSSQIGNEQHPESGVGTIIRMRLLPVLLFMFTNQPFKRHFHVWDYFTMIYDNQCENNLFCTIYDKVCEQINLVEMWDKNENHFKNSKFNCFWCLVLTRKCVVSVVKTLTDECNVDMFYQEKPLGFVEVNSLTFLLRRMLETITLDLCCDAHWCQFSPEDEVNKAI